MGFAHKVEWCRKGFRSFRFHLRFIRPGHLCFDVGANNGTRSIIYVLLGARAVALEPNSEMTKFLRRWPRVTVEHQAVSDVAGQKTFLQNANDHLSSLNPDWKTKWPGFNQWTERTVDCTTLDRLIAKHGCPDYCKIDVEGHEPAVLQGLSQPLKLVSFEVSPDLPKDTLKCIERLAALGRYEYNFSAGDNFSWFSREWVPPSRAAALVNTEAGDMFARLTEGP